MEWIACSVGGTALADLWARDAVERKSEALLEASSVLSIVVALSVPKVRSYRARLRPPQPLFLDNKERYTVVPVTMLGVEQLNLLTDAVSDCAGADGRRSQGASKRVTSTSALLLGNCSS